MYPDASMAELSSVSYNSCAYVRMSGDMCPDASMAELSSVSYNSCAINRMSWS